jgi:hypothetical protein
MMGVTEPQSLTSDANFEDERLFWLLIKMPIDQAIAAIL